MNNSSPASSKLDEALSNSGHSKTVLMTLPPTPIRPRQIQRPGHVSRAERKRAKHELRKSARRAQKQMDKTKSGQHGLSKEYRGENGFSNKPGENFAEVKDKLRIRGVARTRQSHMEEGNGHEQEQAQAPLLTARLPHPSLRPKQAQSKNGDPVDENFGGYAEDRCARSRAHSNGAMDLNHEFQAPKHTPDYYTTTPTTLSGCSTPCPLPSYPADLDTEINTSIENKVESTVDDFLALSSSLHPHTQRPLALISDNYPVHKNDLNALLPPESLIDITSIGELNTAYEFILGLQDEQRTLHTHSHALEDEIKTTTGKVFAPGTSDYAHVHACERHLGLTEELCFGLFVAEYAFRDVLAEESGTLGFDLGAEVRRVMRSVGELIEDYDERMEG